jgi:hypothetical protein
MAPRKIVKVRKQIVWENAKSGEPPSAKHTSLKYFAEQEIKGGNELVKTWKDLTNFNWGTEKETEVNKFLHDMVGCKHLAKDGINFIFWGDEKQERECELHKITEKGGTGFIWIPEQYSEEYNTNSMNTITVKTPEPEKIISVEFFDGTDILKTTKEQYVNLPALGKWVDKTNNIENIDRLSEKPRIKVEFDKPGTHPFTIKLVPDGNNCIYTDDEKARNPKFKYVTEKKTNTENNGVSVFNDMFVTVGGNDTYSLTAEDSKGAVVNSSGKITTMRFFYYVEIKMATIENNVAKNLAVFEGEFLSNYMILKRLSSVEMDYMENISKADEGLFLNKARNAYLSSQAVDKEPYCVAVAYTNHLAVKNPNQNLYLSNIRVGPGKPAITIPVVGPGLTSPGIKRRMLWINLVSGEDWFVDCWFTRKRIAGSPGPPVSITIPKEKCIPDASNPSSPDYFDRIIISVDHLPSGEGTIFICVNWVDRMRAGLSFNNGNLICVCTKAWWKVISEHEQNQTLIHEMGHKVGMVADGIGRAPGILPDKVASLYDDTKGHVGKHCYFDNPDGQAKYDSETDRIRSKCVMYGSTNGKSTFCINCAPAVRKLDITRGWSRF